MNIKKYLMAVGILVTALQLNAAEKVTLPSETAVEQQPTHHRFDTGVARNAFAHEIECERVLEQGVQKCVNDGDTTTLQTLLFVHGETALEDIVKAGIEQEKILEISEKDLDQIKREVGGIRRVKGEALSYECTTDGIERSLELGSSLEGMYQQVSANIQRNLTRLERFRNRSLPRGQAALEKAEGLQKELESIKKMGSTTRPADEIDELLMPSPRALKPLTAAELKELEEARQLFKKMKEHDIPALKSDAFVVDTCFFHIKEIEANRSLINLKYARYVQGQELIKEADELIQELTKIKAELKNNTHVSRPYLVGGIVATVAVVAAVIVYLLYNKKPATV